MKLISPCPLCRKKEFNDVFVKSGRRLVRCINDGLLMINPVPFASEIKRIYEEDYADADRPESERPASIGYWAYVKERPQLLEYFDRKIDLLKKRYHVRGKVLDIGTGHGYFLEAAKERNVLAVGIDRTKQAVEFAKRQKLRVYNTDLHHAPFKPNTFEAVTAFELIEHVADPLVLLKDAYKFLKPGGVIMIATPKAEGYLHKIMGNHWLSFRHRQHFYFFSEKTLSALLNKSGFTDVEVLNDDIRFYPANHIVGGIKYYFRLKSLDSLLSLVEKVLDRLHFFVPIPLDTLVMVAYKP